MSVTVCILTPHAGGTLASDTYKSYLYVKVNQPQYIVYSCLYLNKTTICEFHPPPKIHHPPSALTPVSWCTNAITVVIQWSPFLILLVLVSSLSCQLVHLQLKGWLTSLTISGRQEGEKTVVRLLIRKVRHVFDTRLQMTDRQAWWQTLREKECSAKHALQLCDSCSDEIGVVAVVVFSFLSPRIHSCINKVLIPIHYLGRDN
jgi:hypothetical protein